jgi:formylglycine-generating enzyme required for sulfatase activity
MPEQVRIFVSHSHKDNDFGMRLVKDLRHALGSVDAVWYDAYGGLHGGDDWWETIVKELTARPIFIVVLSPAAITSKYVLSEFKMALQQWHTSAEKRIIPVLYQPCESRADMNMFQRVNFVRKKYRQAFDDLLAALEPPASTPDSNTHAAATPGQNAPIPAQQHDLIESTSLAPNIFPESLRLLGFMPRVSRETVFIYPPLQPVPAGEFLMGSNPLRERDAGPDETPQHKLTLPTFEIARYPVTVAEYRCFIQAGKKEPKERRKQLEHMDHPVIRINWHDALAYAHWLTDLTHEH